MGSNPISSKYRIRGRVVEGSGLIIHFRKNIAGSNPAGCKLIFFNFLILYLFSLDNIFFLKCYYIYNDNVILLIILH